MPDLIGRSLGRYRIVELLGEGGMGKVYRAEDTKLRRDVAVKVLSDEITQDQRHLERFEREARTLAQLSHPNILAIHDFRTEDGVAFAVEEYLEGRDLRRELDRGPMPMERVIEIISAVAEGLGAAHRKGILHRDIKPENIFIQDSGVVKILDFGLARSFGLVSPEGPTKTEPSDLTAPGVIVGTIGYLSPEQARGEELTPRSDVFSLGCVFYEILTATHPFRKKTGAETIAAILGESPPPPSAVNPEVPPALDAIVARCLEKKPGERFESARDVGFAVEALSGPHSATSVTTEIAAPSRRFRVAWLAGIAAVVVLVGGLLGGRALKPPPLPEVAPITVARFEAVGDDPELAYLAAGLSEVVARGLEVVAEDSPKISWVEAARLTKRRKGNDLNRAWRDYNIPLGVVGRLGREGGGIYLSLELVETSSSQQLRNIEIEGRLGNPYSLQVEPVVELARSLGVELSGEQLDRLREEATDVPPALDAFLHGVGRLALIGDDVDRGMAAVEQLEEAAEHDQIFVEARIALASACFTLYKRTGDEAWLDRGTAEAERVARSEPPPVRSLLVLASLRAAANDLDGQTSALRIAVESHPRNGDARRRYAGALAKSGETDEAERQYQRAIYLQPGFWENHHYMAQLHMARGQFDAAATEFRRVVELAPLYLGGYANLGVMYQYLGQNDLARETFEKSLEVEPADNYIALSNLGTLYYLERRFADAAAMFERALEVDDTDYRIWGNLAAAYRFLEGVGRAEAPFRKALELANLELADKPDDPKILCDIADYHAALGERDEGLEAVNAAAQMNITDPMVMAAIAEAYEDLDDRVSALEWVKNAVRAGAPRSEFEDNPTLRDLVADERYQTLVTDAAERDGV